MSTARIDCHAASPAAMKAMLALSAATNNLGLTALIEAVAMGDGSDKYEKIVQLLLDAGADPNMPARAGV
ncbi:ankyrin repeat domain-containing protein, partial [Acinetobacter baumannii]